MWCQCHKNSVPYQGFRRECLRGGGSKKRGGSGGVLNFGAYKYNNGLDYRLLGVVNCQNSQDKGPTEGNSARGWAKALFHNNTKYAFHT